MDELKEVMAALEKAGCERIVVDNGPVGDPQSGMLALVVASLADGDGLIVWSLDSVANSHSELIFLALELENRNIRFRSLTEGFDTQGRQRTAVSAILGQLREFEQQLARRKSQAETGQGRRSGRPRSLSAEGIKRARELLKGGGTMDEVAKELRISRATLYRYLDDGRT
jgi:DNA invertase Pin-like site-specific DNA recombinase